MPDVVINCAAYNDVELAEISYEECYRTNAAGAENVALVCGRKNIKCVHYSSDYVFDGKRKTPGLYTEDDTPHPINNYGLTKYEGDKLVMAGNPNALILRTSWLYGKGERNFMQKVLQWSKEKKHLRIAADEISIPTSIDILASLTLQAINNNLSGLYNATCSGYCSRYDWAKLILETSHSEAIAYPAESHEFAVMCRRPLFSALDNSKLSKALQIDIPNWKTEFIAYMNRRQSEVHTLHKLREETGMFD
jgi:dTDP-4-dehydrorhamnose reductase